MSVWAVVVAALGAAASTAVASAAFKASSRATKISERATAISEKATEIAFENREDALRDGRRKERREFYEAAQRWVTVAKINILGNGTAEFPYEAKQFADLIDSDTAHEIVWWIDNGQRAVIATGSHGSQERDNAYETFRLLFGRYCAAWVRNGKFDWPIYTAPTP
jgi:hypothetical protein